MSAEIMPLGARLRQRREELGLSQAQAANQLDVARTAYRLWELDAARPAPDRWRLIAKWLGISMAAMLHAGELLEEQEVSDALEAARGAGLTSERWDELSGASEGDFFSQERVMIADQLRAGAISEVQATNLRRALGHVQRSAGGDTAEGWHPGRFVKRFPATRETPSLARAALATTALGIPSRVLADAMLVTSELVTNSVDHSGFDWLEVEIITGMERLRVEVSDPSTQTLRPRKDGGGGWGLAVIAELATRWGVERHSSGKTIWVEFDLVADE
jgi:transcriptional regulator with XRE-family HTH domain/anti-sigma regulatory factor (Ser/Thr protein kinase)